MDYKEQKLAENERGKLYFMVGSARSGKSTYSKEISKEYNASIISPDSFRLAIYNSGWWVEGEKMVSSHVDVAVRAMLINGTNVLIDETNVLPNKRKRWRELGGQGFYVECPLEVCLSRANEENNAGFKDNIREMHAALEGFDPHDPEEKILRILATHDGKTYNESIAWTSS